MAITKKGVKDRVVSLLKQGLSIRDVANVTGVARSTIGRWKATLAPDAPVGKNGRPRKLSARDQTRMAQLVTTGKTPTATALKKVFAKHHGVYVSKVTIARYLMRTGLGAFAKLKRPLLSRKHRRDRLRFAMRYRNWTSTDWERVFF